MNVEQAQALGRISNTADGILFLQYLKEECGLHRPSVVMTQTGIDKEATAYNEARRNLYLELRDYIPRERLIMIEIPEEHYGRPDTERRNDDDDAGTGEQQD